MIMGISHLRDPRLNKVIIVMQTKLFKQKGKINTILIILGISFHIGRTTNFRNSWFNAS